MQKPSLLLAALLAAIPANAIADDARFALTPLVGYRFGGNFEIEDSDLRVELDDSASFGLLFNAYHGPNTTWEVLYTQQQTKSRIDPPNTATSAVDTDIHVLHLGGTYHGDSDTVQPYVALTVGGTHVRTATTGSQSDTFFSGSIGIGANVFPRRRFGLRFEARAYGTLTDSSTDLYCSTGPDQNVCAVRIEGTVLSQVETFVGFSYRF